MSSAPPDGAPAFLTQQARLVGAASDFCMVDLDMALTLLDVAATTRDPQTRERNPRNAQHALDMVLRHLSHLELPADMRTRGGKGGRADRAAVARDAPLVG